MRIIAATVLAVGILVVVQSYVWFQAGVPMAAVERYVPPPATGKFAVEITLTFDAEPDAFDFDSVSLKVSRGGETLLDPLLQGRFIEFSHTTSVRQGDEFTA